MASVITGDTTIAATRARVGTSQSVSSVLVLALSTNSGTTYVGGTDVTTGVGFPLVPNAAVEVACDDLADVYVIGTASDHVRWMASAEA